MRRLLLIALGMILGATLFAGPVTSEAATQVPVAAALRDGLPQVNCDYVLSNPENMEWNGHVGIEWRAIADGLIISYGEVIQRDGETLQHALGRAAAWGQRMIKRYEGCPDIFLHPDYRLPWLEPYSWD